MGMQQNQAALKEAYVSYAEGEPQRFIGLVAPEAVIVYFGPVDTLLQSWQRWLVSSLSSHRVAIM